MKKLFVFLAILPIVISCLHAQSLKGVIKDGKRNPIPYSTVFVKEISFGTSANQDGAFELKVPVGNYTCTFQSIGYQSVTKKIQVNDADNPLQIVLPDMIYSLGEVVVSANKEDPAYRIMRKVIGKAPLYAKMVKSYNAEVYIKGSLHVKKISRMIKWLAKDDLKESNIKEGDTYLEESINEIAFTAPNLTRQKVKSLHSTFPTDSKNKSGSAIGFISGSIYSPKAFGEAISPLSPGSFNHYRFRYEGVNSQGDIQIAKIKVIPKGDGPQYVRGYLYIIEGLWCISYLDITINSQLGVTIHLNQSFNEVKSGSWLPVSNRMLINADLMGNEGDFSYNTSIKYTRLEVNTVDFLKASASNSEEAQKVTSAKSTSAKSKAIKRAAKKDEKVKSLIQLEKPTTYESYKLAKLLNSKADQELKDSLRNKHELINTYKTEIDSNAQKHDSVFWNKMRPIPLAVNEQKSVKEFDSIMVKQINSENDTSKKGNKDKLQLIRKILLGGRHEFDTSAYIRINGLVNLWGLSYNIVDGFVYKTGFSLQKMNAKGQKFLLKPSVGYAFSRKAILWNLYGLWTIGGRNKQWLALNCGEHSQDYNQEGGPVPLENSIASLFFRENLSRLYNSRFIEIGYGRELTSGFSFSTKLKGSDNSTLDNSSDFSLFYRNEKSYLPNIPDNEGFRMESHRDLIFAFGLSYKPIPYYYYVKNVKTPRNNLNDTPTFSLYWIKGIPMSGIKSDFDLIKAGIEQRKNLNASNFLKYNMEMGKFLNAKSIFFDNQKQFNVQPLVVGLKDYFPCFQLLNYYNKSTFNYYAEGHFQYQSRFILLKRLPLIRNRAWNESLFASYLFMPEAKNYIELGYGIGNSFYNAGVFSAFKGINYQQTGIRISISIFGQKEISF
jgi:hypothetical protein